MVSKQEEAKKISRVGKRLRQERISRGLSIDNLAAAVGLTKGFISQVERGESSASLSSLIRICSFLKLELSQLFEEPSIKSGLLRKADRSPAYVAGKGFIDFLLTPKTERRLQVVEAEIEPLGSAGDEFFTTTAEIAVVYVLSGSLEFKSEQGQVVLQAWDTLTFLPREPHTYGNPSNSEPTRAVFFIVPAIY